MMFGHLLQDVRYGARQLWRSPLLTVVGAASLGVGISVAVAVFSLINSVLFKPLPLPDPDRIVHVYSSSPGLNKDGGEILYSRFAYPDLADLQATGVFTAVVAQWDHSTTIAAGKHAPRQGEIAFVSPDYFDVLGITPAAGRSFTAHSAEPEIIISEQYRRRTFDDGENVIGSTVRIRDAVFTIIGVAPADFHGFSVGRSSAGWVAVTAMPHVMPQSGKWVADREVRSWSVTARLAPHVSRDAAAARLALTARALSDVHPSWRTDRAAPLRITLLTHRQSIVRPADKELIMALATVTALVLAILLLACTNVAGLLLARALTRRHEIAVRITLGASRSRLVSQLLTESVLLALLGGFIGFLGAQWALTLAARSPLFDAFDLAPDWRVAALATTLSLLTAVVFGITPIGQSLRVDVKSGLTGHGLFGERVGVRGRLIVLQVCLSCLLMVIAFSAGRGVRARLYLGPDFDVDRLVVAELQLSSLDSLQRVAYIEHATETLRSLPAVLSVTTTRRLPASQFGEAAESRMDLPGTGPTLVGHHDVTAGYFETIGITLLNGRMLRPDDMGRETDVAVVNRAFQDAWGSGVVGRTIAVDDRQVQIVGVVENVKHSAREKGSAPYMYWAARNTPWSRPTRLYVLARVRSGEQQNVATTLIRSFRERYEDRVPPSVTTLRARLEALIAPQRYLANIALVLGVMELALASLGVYSLLLYALLARSREIGLRMALGAKPRDASFTVIRGGLTFIAIGTGLGLIASIAAAIFVGDNVIGIDVADPMPFAAMLLAVMLSSAAAAYVPARRAARVEPMTALRHE